MIDRRSMLWAAGGATACWAAGLPTWNASAQSSVRARRVIFVHGRSQQGRDADTIKEEWVKTLREGAQKLGRQLPTDLQVSLPFYGDKLDWFASQWRIPIASDIQARGRSEEDSELLAFQWQIAEELRVKARITDEQVNAEYGPDPKPRGPMNWNWVQAILKALDKHGPGMSKATLETFTRDVYLYTTRTGVQDEINRIVSSEFTEEPTVVVGHSLGSVVAYTILRTERRPLKVPLFVTVGSPLGIRAIREQYLPLRYPEPPLGKWYNAFDTRDAIALYPLDRDNFPVNPAIENYSEVRNQTDNRHGIIGYLNDAQVVKKLLDALQ